MLKLILHYVSARSNTCVEACEAEAALSDKGNGGGFCQSQDSSGSSSTKNENKQAKAARYSKKHCRMSEAMKR